jgi:hypothetical protein
MPQRHRWRRVCFSVNIGSRLRGMRRWNRIIV